MARNLPHLLVVVSVTRMVRVMSLPVPKLLTGLPPQTVLEVTGVRFLLQGKVRAHFDHKGEI
jgi:hypothetical protein